MLPVKANPYSPPLVRTAVARSSAGAALALSILLFGCAVLGGARAVIYLAAAYRWEWSNRTGLPIERGLVWSWSVYRLLFMATLLLFCVWIYRANRDARRLGGELAFRPGWAVAVSFIPVVNLIAPYRAVKEIHAAASNETSVRLPVVGLWWSAWILSLAWQPLSGAFLVADSELWREAVREALRSLAALLLLVVVEQIERRQERRAVASEPVDGGASAAIGQTTR